jgi:pimeloyl-ACP methyl ester carboxylesterase
MNAEAVELSSASRFLLCHNARGRVSLVQSMMRRIDEERCEIRVTAVHFVSHRLRLSGAITSARSDPKPEILFLNGAGNATKERTGYVAVALAGRTRDSFGFDFSGQGASQGTVTESSLLLRVEEALSSLSFFEKREPLMICASSMGAHIALELLGRGCHPKALVLFCPAVYSDAARGLSFGPAFSAAIRKPESWAGANVVAHLDGFGGRVLIVIGERDEVIPRGVLERIRLASHSVEVTVVPEAPHRIHSWLVDRPRERELVIGKILELL